MAIVIGSGMCGLAVAQVLSKHFDSVLVVEKDQPLSMQQLHALDAARMESKSRPGVLQYNQLHALTPKGLLTLDEIFDGRFSKTLAAAGGHIVNHFDSVIIHHPACGLKPWMHHVAAKEPVHMALCTRHMFETTARKLLVDNPHVQFAYGMSVTGLVMDGEGAAPDSAVTAGSDKRKSPSGGGRVTGVRLSDGSTRFSQLVVDCSGRGSNLPGWLDTLGYKRPRTSRASCDAGYAGWLCKLDPKVEKVLDDNNVSAVVTFAAPPERTMCLLLRVEDGLCIAGLGGNEGLYPGRGEDEILQFAREKVWHPSASTLLSGSTFMAPVNHAHHLSSTWRHYEDITLPDGLLVLGDSVCSLNPTYGQGMTVAAIEASTLHQLLSERAASAGKLKQPPAQHSRVLAVTAPGVQRKAVKLPAAPESPVADTAAVSDRNSSTAPSHSHISSGEIEPASASTQPLSKCSDSTEWLSGLNHELQQAVFPHVKAAWNLAVGSDMRFAGATSNEPFTQSIVERLAMAYILALFKLASLDALVNEAVVRMIGMVDPPECLFQPRVLSRYLWHTAADYTPLPLKKLLAAALKVTPWGQATYTVPAANPTLSPPVAATAAAAAQPGSKEAALQQLMGWPLA